MSAPDPLFSIDEMLPAGQVMQRASYDALASALAANGGTPLSQTQIAAAVGPALPFPAELPILDMSDPAQNPWALRELV